MLIYKIVAAEEWTDVFKSHTLYQGSAKDRQDGFIHFSTGGQLVETLKLHYRQALGALAVVAVDVDVLGEALRWEPSRNGDLFPHLYGPLPIAAAGRMTVGFYETLAADDFATIREFAAGTGTFADPETGSGH